MSLDAFVNYDAELAKRVIEGDRYIDDVCDQMLRELLTYMFEDPSTISRALRLMFGMARQRKLRQPARHFESRESGLIRGKTPGVG